jgi:hypothetical protein
MADPSGPALELRLERGRALVRHAGAEVARGARVDEVVLAVPLGGALDVAGGPARFRSVLCELERLELRVAPGALEAAVSRATPAGVAGASSLRAAARPGFLELAGALDDGAPFTAKLAAVAGGGPALRAAVYEARLYAPSALPGPALATRLAEAIAAALPAFGARAEGAFLSLDVARPALLAILPRRGWKLPRLPIIHADGGITRDGAWATLTRGDADAAPAPDPDLRALLHGAPAFAKPERLLAEGDLDGARDAWRALPPGARAHPFAAGRTLGFLAADARFHAEARALARGALEREPAFAPALLVDAVLARARGDLDRAATSFSALALAAAARAEAFSALAAADACAACGEAADAAALGAALDAALALDRGHLPALRARRDLAERQGDRGRLLRALRGLAAHADDAGERALAHERLAELLAVTDPAAARLHRDHARRVRPR